MSDLTQQELYDLIDDFYSTQKPKDFSKGSITTLDGEKETVALKPCPFCGSNNITCPLPWIIYCDSCGFEFYPPCHFGEGLTDKQR